MALIQCDFYSEVLGISTSMYVILPQSTKTQIGMEGVSIEGKHPTLYLLHGLTDDHSTWLRRTSIERYVSDLGLAVVMPAVNRSFYTDMLKGAKYWTFISEELPSIARSFFPLSDLREENFVAGNSMGGYGAFKLALRCPDKFIAAASLSGAMDVKDGNIIYDASEFTNVFGDRENLGKSDNDLFNLVKKVAASDGPKPKLYQCCGFDDFLYNDNLKFRNFCKNLPIDLTYEEEPGIHEWDYWDLKIQRILQWFPIRKFEKDLFI